MDLFDRYYSSITNAIIFRFCLPASTNYAACFMDQTTFQYLNQQRLTNHLRKIKDSYFRNKLSVKTIIITKWKASTLRSRWAMSWLCRNSIARQISNTIFAASDNATYTHICRNDKSDVFTYDIKQIYYGIQCRRQPKSINIPSLSSVATDEELWMDQASVPLGDFPFLCGLDQGLLFSLV